MLGGLQEWVCVVRAAHTAWLFPKRFMEMGRCYLQKVTASHPPGFSSAFFGAGSQPLVSSQEANLHCL